MRTIKFRGKEVGTGKLVYGSLHVEANGEPGIIPAWNPNIEIPVEPDSVAQLVGHDVDGNEIYEGDVLEYDYGDWHYEYIVELRGMAWTADGSCYIGERQFEERRLKRR